jgi:hypothetical protein
MAEYATRSCSSLTDGPSASRVRSLRLCAGLRQTDLTSLLERSAHPVRQLGAVDIDLIEQCGRVDVLVPIVDTAVDG